MRPIVTDVAWSVCLLYTTVLPAKTDEPIKMPFGGQAYVLNESCIREGDAHWRHLANTICDAASRYQYCTSVS